MGRGGEKSLLCDPGSELRLGGREKKKGEDNKQQIDLRAGPANISFLTRAAFSQSFGNTTAQS